MKRETLEKRIAKHLTNKAGNIYSVYKEPLDWLKTGRGRAYPCRWHKNGRHFSLDDKSKRYFEMLKALGIDYTTGNDSPKGGAEGFYLELTPKGLRQVKEFQAYYKE